MNEERFKQLAKRCTTNYRVELDIIVALKEAVNEALQEAAKACEAISGDEPSGSGGRFGALDCAEAIRKLTST